MYDLYTVQSAGDGENIPQLDSIHTSKRRAETRALEMSLLMPYYIWTVDHTLPNRVQLPIFKRVSAYKAGTRLKE